MAVRRRSSETHICLEENGCIQQLDDFESDRQVEQETRSEMIGSRERSYLSSDHGEFDIDVVIV